MPIKFIYKVLGACFFFTCIFSISYAQITDVSTSMGYIMHPMSRSTVGMNRVVNQTAPIYNVAIGFNLLKSPFKIKFSVVYLNSEFIAYKSSPFYNADGTEGSYFGLSLKKVFVIHKTNKSEFSLNTGWSYVSNDIDPDNQNFGTGFIALTEPNYQGSVQVNRKFSSNVSEDFFLTNSIHYSYLIWRKVNVGLYAQFDYGFGKSAHFLLSQQIIRAEGPIETEPIEHTVQEVSILRNYLSFGFTFGLGL